MKTTVKLLLTSCLMTAFFACSPKAETEPQDMETVRADIQAMEDAFAAGEAAKDADAVAAYYADDAISYGRNREPLVGKAAIKENIAKDLAADSSSPTYVYKLVDVFAEDDMVVEIGSWTKTNADGSANDKGHFMSYFKKQDGKYACVRDMSVSSSPVKPSAP